MDGTLIENECIDEIAREIGVIDQVSMITKKAMEEGMDFSEALKQRVALLKGMPELKLENVWKRLKFKPSTCLFIKLLKENGFKVAIVSGGFTYFTNRIAQNLDIDYNFSNVVKKKFLFQKKKKFYGKK